MHYAVKSAHIKIYNINIFLSKATAHSFIVCKSCVSQGILYTGYQQERKCDKRRFYNSLLIVDVKDTGL